MRKINGLGLTRRQKPLVLQTRQLRAERFFRCAGFIARELHKKVRRIPLLAPLQRRGLQKLWRAPRGRRRRVDVGLFSGLGIEQAALELCRRQLGGQMCRGEVRIAPVKRGGCKLRRERRFRLRLCRLFRRLPAAKPRRIVQADPPRERLRAAPFVRPGLGEQRAGLRPAERRYQHPITKAARLSGHKGPQWNTERTVPFFEHCGQFR